jgi:phage host-nuclease inhibitor protein Gam
MDRFWNTGPGSPYEDNKYLFESEDEGMNNLALQLNEEEIQEGFKIDNDNLAEWALNRISEERAEAQRLINVCQTKIDECLFKYQSKIKDYQEHVQNKTAFLTGKLQEYFATVPHKATKTQETYKLPSGTLKKKYGTPEYKVDNEKLVKWLKDAGLNNFVKTEEKAQWGELKKTVTVSFDKILTADGEVVDGVTAQERPDSFEIEV